MTRDVQLSSGTTQRLTKRHTNSIQGQTYDSVIEETVKASQQDFIEAGISLDYLESLRTVLPPHPIPQSLPSDCQIWQSKLTASKAATFPWARPTSPIPAAQVQREPSPQQSSETPQQHYHNPAMAALRAMQQVQHQAASLPETSNGASLVVNQLAQMAQEQNERFKHEQEMRKLREEEEKRLKDVKREEDDLFGDGDLGNYNSSYGGSKRDISQVDSPEENMRPAPTFMVQSPYLSSLAVLTARLAR